MATREKRQQAPHLHAVKPAEATTPADHGVKVPAAQVVAAKPTDTTAPADHGGKVPPAQVAAAAKAPARAVDPEVVPGPLRRTFTAEFKRQVLVEADACSELGAVGELLRRHGLYSSHLTEWRRQRDEGLRPKKRGRKGNPDRALVEENARLRRENVRLEHRLTQAEVIIDVQKKLSLLLGIPLKTPDSDGSDE